MDELVKYQQWLEFATEDPDLVQELMSMGEQPKLIKEAFYQDLAFGTGGLRGVLGAGSSRVNIYTIAKASQGLANYVIKNFPTNERKIAIAYDSRIKSDLFATISAEVFAASGIQVYMYKELMPTPCLSYAVRELQCAGGVVVTASHNPAKYNGYKVYGSDGCQITTLAANEITTEIEQVEIFEGVKRIPFATALEKGNVAYIEESIITQYIEAVKAQSLLSMEDGHCRSQKIVYTPLYGAGLKPVVRTLKECGFSNLVIVEEQAKPNGNFPTCPYPNPEVRGAMERGIAVAQQQNADLLLATDPDCDRIGIAVRDKSGEYRLFTGNETGILLLDYICQRRIASKQMPEHPVFIKSIVTTDMAQRIAKSYGVTTINVLTGFKYIGEQIGMLEACGRSDSYLFGFEESYGYLAGTYVRDKDAVVGAMLICEMFAFYAAQDISLLERLHELYRLHGYTLDSLHSFEYEGIEGITKIQTIMEHLRQMDAKLGNYKIKEFLDFKKGCNGLPPSDMVKLVIEGEQSVVVRPSGTEPKIKFYLSITAKDRETALEVEAHLLEALKCALNL